MSAMPLTGHCSTLMAKHSTKSANSRTPMPTWQRWGIYVLAIILTLSGTLWLYFEHFIRVESEFGAEHHPLQHLWLVVHGSSAMPMLWLTGVIWTAHIKRGWRQKNNRKSGLVLAIALIALTVSAAALYYLADEQLRSSTSTLHWLLGLALPVLLIIHIVIGRRAKHSAL